jgi:hypothetical protein
VAPADLDVGYLDGRGHRAPPSRCLRVRAAREIVPYPSIGAFLPSPSTRALGIKRNSLSYWKPHVRILNSARMRPLRMSSMNDCSTIALFTSRPMH